MTLRWLVTGLVALFVAMLVPAALAAERPDDAAGPIGVGSVAQAEVQLEAVRPDDLAERFTPAQGEPAATRPDDRAERFTPGATAVVVAAEPTDYGIAWSDPLIVGVVAALVVGIAMAAVFAVVHYRGGGPGTRGTTGRPTLTH